MKLERFIARKMHDFYEEVSEKIKNKLMKHQTDQEFIQNKVKN